MPLSLESIRTSIISQMDLPVVPAIAGRVIKELTNPKSNAEDLAQIIRHDQALAGRILRIANSPVYRRRIPTTSIDAAIVRMGRDLVKDLVISLSTQSLFRKFDHFEEQLWGHAVATGIAATHVAAMSKKLDPAEAFVGGLLHDVGKIVLNNSSRARYRQATQKAIDSNVAYHIAETEEFNFHHGPVGAVLLEVWGLSQPLIDSALYHHNIELWDEISEESLPLLSIVILANQLVNSLQINVGSREIPVDFPASCLELLELDPISVESLLEPIHEAYLADKGLYLS